MRDLFNAFTDNWIGRIIGIIFLSCVVMVVWYSYFLLTHKCIASHEEIQYHQPIGIVVGGGKNGGGMSVPLGNVTQVKVKVCDKYE